MSVRDAIMRMRARIRMMKPVRGEDDLGGAAMTWMDEGAAWAWIEAIGAEESASFDRLEQRARYRMSIRLRIDIAAGWRVIWGSRAFRVTSVLFDETARVSLTCESVDP